MASFKQGGLELKKGENATLRIADGTGGGIELTQRGGDTPALASGFGVDNSYYRYLRVDNGAKTYDVKYPVQEFDHGEIGYSKDKAFTVATDAAAEYLFGFTISSNADTELTTKGISGDTFDINDRFALDDNHLYVVTAEIVGAVEDYPYNNGRYVDTRRITISDGTIVQDIAPMVSTTNEGSVTISVDNEGSGDYLKFVVGGPDSYTMRWLVKLTYIKAKVT